MAARTGNHLENRSKPRHRKDVIKVAGLVDGYGDD